MLIVVLGCAVSAPPARADVPVDIQTLSGVERPSAAAVVSGALDERFGVASRGPKGPQHEYWLKLSVRAEALPAGIPVLVVHSTPELTTDLYGVRDGAPQRLALAAQQSAFLGVRDDVYLLPAGFTPGLPVYAHVQVTGNDRQSLDFSASSLRSTLAQGARASRSIALAFGALMAVSVAALLLWFVLADRLFILYASLFALQGLYVACLSGQGFDWPWLAWAAPLGAFAWNVPAALSGAAACLFTREIADLKRTPAVYAAFGWLALAFVLLAFANAGKYVGLEPLVNNIGNLMFLGAPVFTLVVCFLAWRRGNRAAGWFLIAWLLLEGCTMAAALSFLTRSGQDGDPLYYLGLPLSMVAASILTALGVADRLRAQRLALSDAERRARIDPLTGVLNRRSLLERLEAACQRAQARGLPIALLFIDLDHFKLINDTYGHPAGDACLRGIIAPIHAELRQSDVIGRYGGEEFVVILSSADASAAAPIAQRILERVAQVRIDGFGAPIGLTCSIGIATSDTLGVWGEQLIAQADAAVYLAKRSGRNQVQMARAVPA